MPERQRATRSPARVTRKTEPKAAATPTPTPPSIWDENDPREIELSVTASHVGEIELSTMSCCARVSAGPSNSRRGFQRELPQRVLLLAAAVGRRLLATERGRAGRCGKQL